MEERRIKVFQREVSVGRKELELLPQLLTQEELQQWRLTQNELAMLNCMLYFVVYVREKMQHPTFEQHVRKTLSQLYLENRMQIRLNQLSRATSSALHVDLTECIHILYYLVYGRFASVAYVNMIAQNREQKVMKKVASNMGYPISPVVETPRAGVIRTRHFDKKTSWNFASSCSQNDMESFSHELEAMLKTKKTYLRLDLPATEEQSQNEHSQRSSLGVKLRRVKNRQTSPLMNLLRNQTHTSFESIRVNRRILDSTKTTLSQTFISASKRERQTMPSLQKPQKEKISLKAVLDIRQKLKSQNVFLDELRKSLMSHSCVHPLRKRQQPEYRYQTTYGQPLAEIQKANVPQSISEKAKPSTFEEQTPVSDLKPPMEERLQTEFPTENDSTTTDFRQPQGSNEAQTNQTYRLLAESQKQPFRLKLTFYKRKFKEFLKGQQQRSSLLM